jgi:hypothetical protein
VPVYNRTRVFVPDELYNPTNDAELATIAEAFRQYWLSGYSNIFGRDAPLDRPATVKAAAIAHVHILRDGASAITKRNWNRKADPELAPMDRGTSDAMVIYAASQEGTAILLAYFGEPGHERLRNGNLALLQLSAAALKIFRDIQEEPMFYDGLMEMLRTSGLEIKNT